MTQLVKNTSYHHGNLRQALLDAAKELAAENTIDSITLREVARRAGVSHAAPYHHFADKRALLRAIALNAFTELNIKLQLQHLEPKAKLYAIGLEYIRFALAHPTEFRFMFRKNLCEPKGTPDELTNTANQSFEILIEAVRALQATGLVTAGSPQELALVVWSAIHGLASLLIEAPIIAEPITDSSLEQLMNTMQTTLQNGLIVRKA